MGFPEKSGQGDSGPIPDGLTHAQIVEIVGDIDDAMGDLRLRASAVVGEAGRRQRKQCQ